MILLESQVCTAAGEEHRNFYAGFHNYAANALVPSARGRHFRDHAPAIEDRGSLKVTKCAGRETASGFFMRSSTY
jgi:hypothetical protein